MPRNPNLLELRNNHIKERYRLLCKKHPQWKSEAIIQQISIEVFLSTVMIAKILYQTGTKAVPAPSTVYRKQITVAA